MKCINVNFGFSYARNAEHYQLHKDILAVITPEFATAQGFASQQAAYSSNMEIENVCYLRNYKYWDTEELVNLDAKRDSLFGYVLQTIKAAMNSPVDEVAAAAKRLWFIIEPHKDAARLNYTSNTASVSDFLEKMATDENAAYAAAVGLTLALQQLGEVNTQFHTLYTSRSSELLARATSETMRTIRPKVDETAKECFECINACYRFYTLMNQEPEKRAALETAIDLVNALLIQLQNTLAHAGVTSKPGTDSDNAPSDNPTDGGDDNGDDPTPPPYEPEEDEPVVQ